MARHYCDDCGKTFNSRTNLDHHQELRCEGGASTGAGASDGGRSTDDPRKEITTGDRIRGAEGTVDYYDEDGGYGFVLTADLAGRITPDTGGTEDVFFHISDAGTGRVREGDRLRFDVVEGDEGLECRDVAVLTRASQREYEEPENDRRTHGFGHGKDDSAYGPGKSAPTDQDIEDFSDERKFR